jgi:transposase
MKRRGRKIKVSVDLSQVDWVSQIKQENNAKTKIRLLAMSHLRDGKSITETAKALKIHHNNICRWLRQFAADGLQGLRHRQGAGAKRKITQERAFRESVLELQANQVGGRIRGLDVLEMMEKKLGVKCHLMTAYNYLKRAQFVWITGRTKHPKSDQAIQEAFKKTSKE